MPRQLQTKIEFIDLFGSVRWSCDWGEECLQQVAEGLNHADISDWNNLLESLLKGLQAYQNVAIKQDC